jgi:hypothetical protein
MNLFLLIPFRCCHCRHRFFWLRNSQAIPVLTTALLLTSALLLGAWFAALHAIWQAHADEQGFEKKNDRSFPSAHWRTVKSASSSVKKQ